jgi:stage II sporulation protein D
VVRVVGWVTLFLLLIIVGLPAVLVRGLDFAPPPIEPESEPVIVKLLLPGGSVERIPLEEYVKGVVAAEMPTSFHMEALKAQAVVARTYAVRRLREKGGTGAALHPEADLTADPSVDQAYVSKDEARARWGIFTFRQRWARVEEAVDSTKGLIVTYDSIVIDPVYHSTSGGYTENSEDVWQEALPYLRSVPCPWDSHSPYYKDTMQVEYDRFAMLLGDVPVEALAASAEPIRVMEASSTGRVKSIRVGDRTLSGREFRSLLGLRSTLFSWRLTPEGVVFTTTGFGHGVGMCQYGADGMAREGRDFRSIIKYFYKGVEIVPAFGG